jgi:hypothetical protein
MRQILVSLAAATLAACSQSNKEAEPATTPLTTAAAPAAEAAPEAAATDSDPCALVANPEALFGQPVTAGHNTNPNHTVDCQWKSADGRLCGSLTVFGPGYNDVVADPKTNFEGMSKSLGAFGDVTEVTGIGEEARQVDGGMFGAQLAFHQGRYSVLAASACSSAADQAPALAHKLAEEVAARL